MEKETLWWQSQPLQGEVRKPVGNGQMEPDKVGDRTILTLQNHQ